MEVIQLLIIQAMQLMGLLEQRLLIEKNIQWFQFDRSVYQGSCCLMMWCFMKSM